MIRDYWHDEEDEGAESSDDDTYFQGNDIVYYIVDEDDNEIGYGYRLEGKIYEYYYENTGYAAGNNDSWNDGKEELDINGMYTYYEESEFY